MNYQEKSERRPRPLELREDQINQRAAVDEKQKRKVTRHLPITNASDSRGDGCKDAQHN